MTLSTQQPAPADPPVVSPHAEPHPWRAPPGLAVRWAGGLGAVIPLIALVFVLATLIIEALPAIRLNGLHFFTATEWNPGNLTATPLSPDGVPHPAGAYYGALPLIVGTLASSAIALIVAVPVSIGAALAIVERLPKRPASAVGMVLELLAGIPSVVVGLWGAMTFGPFIAHHIAPVIARNAPDVPVLNYFRGDTGNGEGLLVSGLVLAVMIIPIIATTCRDLIRQVPSLPREGATALGMSDWECARRVTLPWVSSGIVGAVVLGLGRALGETMAVAMVSGAELGAMPTNIYSTMTTIAATVVSQLDSALTDSTNFAVKTLAEASLVLMVITLADECGGSCAGAPRVGDRATSRARYLKCGRSPLGAKTVNALWWTACFCCLAMVIAPTLWMLIGVVGRAVPVFHWSVLVEDSHGGGGGLRNAIVGTAVLGLGVMLVGGTVSVLTGIYLSEFATGRTRSILRGAYEVLSGIPSIVLGYVGYLALVVDFDWGFPWRPGS